MSLVLDASVTLAWCFADERTPDMVRLLDRVIARGAVVPPIWRSEVANGLLVACRRKRLDETTRTDMLESLSALPIRPDLDADRHTWTTTVRLADDHALSVYDASYLEAALRLRLPLATGDGALSRAARAALVPAA